MMRRVALVAAAASLLLAACGSLRREPEATSSGPGARPPATAQVPSQPARPVAPPARSGRGAYYQDDGPGENPPPNLEATPDAVPADEPLLRSAANRPYVVFGKTYTPLSGDSVFRQRGVGSWYGRKFHGQKTSSGEPYDMYAMTAAHPTLPLPSYVRVTNPGNGRSVIVRVNDRGPFHSERIIDLSYTAALKLGYAAQGSAVIEIERIRPGDAGLRPPVETVAKAGNPAAVEPVRPAVQPTGRSDARSADPAAAVVAAVQSAQLPVPAAPAAGSETAVLATSTQPDGVYLQLGAFGAREGAEEFRIKTYQQLPWLAETIYIVARDRLHRVQLGPFADRGAAQAVADRIRDTLQLKPVFVLR
jgi:rare lipoprotein A